MVVKQNTKQMFFARLSIILNKFNWEGNVIVAFLLSLFESLMLFVAHNVQVSDLVHFFVFNFNHQEDKGFIKITELLTIFINTFLLWLSILIVINAVFLLREKISIRIFKHFFSCLVWAVFSLFLLFWINNWVYFWHNDNQFLNRDLILFGMSNCGHLLWHIIQFSSSLFVVIISLTCSLSLLFWLTLRRVFLHKRKRISQKKVIWLIIVVFIVCVFLNAGNRKNWKQQRASIIAMFSFSQKDYREIDVIKKYCLIKKTRKIDYTTISVENPVIIVYIESMRHDLAYVQPSPLPNILSLIPDNIFFERAYAVSSHSNYADVSFWFSQFPLRSQNLYVYDKNSRHKGVSVFDVFKKLGYKTGYISSQNETWGGMINWMKNNGIDYFFHAPDYKGDTYVDSKDAGFAHFAKNFQLPGKIPDKETLAVARQWIKNVSSYKKFFLGINLQNTHYSYYLPKVYDAPFKPMDDFSGMFSAWSKDDLVNVRNRFLNSFYNVDKLVGDFINFLKHEKIWDRCLFMVVGDNGEAFYEHGYANHAGFMHEEVIRAFALMKVPSPTKSAVVSYPVSHLDLMSGVLDVLQIPQPYSFQGISPFILKRENIYLHANAIRRQDGVIHWPWKLLIDNTNGYIELYNLEIDPLEKLNMCNENRNIVDSLMSQLTQWKDAQLVYYSNPNFYNFYYPPQFK